MMRNYFDVPMQVIFESTDPDGELHTNTGIAYKDEIICLCCGGVFEVSEIKILGESFWWYEMSGEEFKNKLSKMLDKRIQI